MSVTGTTVKHASVSVLIVGAGPTGLAVANLLGMYSIKTLLIERNIELYCFPRAISIDDEGLRICQALGLREEILQHVLLDMGALYLSRGKRLVHVQPVSLRNGYPLISTFNQPQLEAILLTGLKRFPAVDVRFGHRLETFSQTDQGVIASIATTSGEQLLISCDYLLACDGGKSRVRHLLGIPMRGMTFSQRWLVVDGHYNEEEIPARHVTFFCDPTRPAVSVPSTGKGRRWEFMLLPGEREEQMLLPDNIQRLIRQVEGRSHVFQIIRQAVYTFHAASATTFSQGRVFLLGDAAHLLPPFGGQGMNSGLRDAHNLAWKLSLVLRSQARPDILETYQQERAPHARRMIRFSSLMGSIIMPTHRLIAGLRDAAIHTLMLLPPVASTLTELRVKPGAYYRRGLLLSDGGRLSRLLVGQLLPQPVVVTRDGRSVLLDEVLAPGSALLRLHAEPREAFKSLQADLWQELNVRFICVIPAAEHVLDIQESSQPIISILDSQQQVASFLRYHSDFYVFIRPDRYVLGIFHAEREQAFVTALRKYILTSRKTPLALQTFQNKEG